VIPPVGIYTYPAELAKPFLGRSCLLVLSLFFFVFCSLARLLALPYHPISTTFTQQTHTL
jgi:hypothetical protein